MYYNTQQNQYNVRPSLARIKYGLYESKEIFTYLRNNGQEKCDQMNKERSSLTFNLKLDTHAS